MNRLGMMIDISHVSSNVMRDVLKSSLGISRNNYSVNSFHL